MTTLTDEEFNKALHELPDNSELGMEGRYWIIIQGIEALKRRKWWQFKEKRRINQVIKKAVSNCV